MDSKTLQVRAVEQWTRSLPLTAKRGQILDANGNILAVSATSYDVYIRAKEVKDATLVANYLSSVLGVDRESTYLKAKNAFISESLVKLQVDEEVARRITEKNLDGVYLAENIKRFYPYDNSLCQVMGFLTSDSIGQSGIESYYDKVLSGVDGKILTQSDVRGVILDDSLKYYLPSTDGMNVKLNIDINIQLFAEEVLNTVMEEQKPKKASVVIMDPMTSKVIALAITPNYSLNEIPRDNVSELMVMTKNSLVTDVYEPGSTFKILTLAAALSEGLTNEHEHFYCPGYRIVDGQKIKCWKTTGHGSQTLVEAVQNSCNCCFMDLGLRLGKEKLYKYLQACGIGSSTGVDMQGESSGLLLNIDDVKTCDLVRIAFGQTVAVSGLQLLNAFCSCINGGVLNTPEVMNSLLDGEKVAYDNPIIAKNKTISSDVNSQLRYLLEMSLSKAGEMTFINGYKIAGKTGTAQKFENGQIARGKYVSSFFGFINQGENPSFAVLLCVDEASNGAYYGSVVAKPYAKMLFERIIEYKNIEPVATVSARTFEVPNLVGLSLADAINKLEKLGVYYDVDGEGGKVLGQYPLAKSIVSCDSAIVIST